MKKGFRLIDGSIWSIISYTSTEPYLDKDDSAVFPNNVTEVVGVKWEKHISETHPYRANFSDCNFETFLVTDPKIESIVKDVFDYEND